MIDVSTFEDRGHDVSTFEDGCVDLRRSIVDVKLGCYTPPPPRPISGPLLMGKALQLFPLAHPDDHNVVTQTVSHSQACQALETVLVYLEQQPEIPMSITVLLNTLLTQTARKRFQTLI